MHTGSPRNLASAATGVLAPGASTSPAPPSFRVIALAASIAFAYSPLLAAQPIVELRDSIVLEESGDDYLVLPGPVISDGTGGYLVTDYQQPRVFHYSQDGRLIQRYGDGGQGPGEWYEAQVALPQGTGHVLVLSWKPFAAQLFERSSGRFVERFPLEGHVQFAVLEGEELWIGGPRYSPRSSVRRLKLGEEEAEPVVELPNQYKVGGPVGGIFSDVPFAKWADTLLVGFMPLPFLILSDENGRELDRFEVPAVHRRAASSDPEAAIMERMRSDGYAAVFDIFSLAQGLHRRPDGTFLLVHTDLRAEDPPVSTEALWVSVIDEDRTRACPDARIPLGPGSRPAIGFDGVMVLVLEQPLRGGDAVSVLRRITVETEDCDWVPLKR